MNTDVTNLGSQSYKPMLKPLMLLMSEQAVAVPTELTCAREIKDFAEKWDADRPMQSLYFIALVSHRVGHT